MRFSFGSSRTAAATLLPCFLAVSLGLAVPMVRADDAPAGAAPAAPRDTVRPEVGKPLQAAQAAMKDKKFKDALERIHEAETVPNRTPYENFIIDQMRGSAAANDGQDDLAMSSYEAVVASGRLPAPDQLKLEQAIAITYYNKLKNYSKSATWAARYIKEGGTDPTAQDLLINSYYLNNDFNAASAELKSLIEADEKAGRTTSEPHLLLQYTCYQKLNNTVGTSVILEKLLVGYAKKDYWELAISHLQHGAAFAERLDLDLLRLRFKLDDLKRESDFMALSQLALEAGFPTEAKEVVDKGYAAGILGKGPEAERHKRLQNKVNKDAADDIKSLGQGDADAEKAKGGDGLLNAGYNYVLNGKFEKGLSMMEQGLHRGGLKHPEDAKIHMGIAYYLAGEKAKAVQVLHTVQGSDGAGDLAHLWAVYAGRS